MNSPSDKSVPSLQDPEVAALVASLRDIAQAKEARIAHIYKRTLQAADLIELVALREKQAPAPSLAAQNCNRCGGLGYVAMTDGLGNGSQDICPCPAGEKFRLIEEGAEMVADIESLTKDLAASGNYVCDRDTNPQEVTFANGRTVRLVGEGYLVIGHAAPPSPQAPQVPVLKKNAQIGGTIFGPGIKVSTLIGRAEREYEYQHTPEAIAERQKRLRQFVDAAAGTAVVPPYSDITPQGTDPSHTAPQAVPSAGVVDKEKK